MKSSFADKHLRKRVKLLGRLLGEVLLARADGRVYAVVETLRKGYINLREQDNPSKRKQLHHLIQALSPEVLRDVIRAFNIYFSLINIADEQFQHYQRMMQIQADNPFWEGSFDATLREFVNEGMNAEQLQQLFNRLVFMPVITAHPTEARRRTIMLALRRIFVTLAKLNRRLSRAEREEVLEALKAQIHTLWKTDEVRLHALSVLDEVKNGLNYFRESLFIAVPLVYRSAENSVKRFYDNPETKIVVPSFLRFGSWIGGDRDGNPYVTPEITATALRLHTLEILREYARRVLNLVDILTHSREFCQLSQDFLRSLEQDILFCQRENINSHDYHRYELYRRKLLIIYTRLTNNIDVVQARLDGTLSGMMIADKVRRGYAQVDELYRDLLVIRDSLLGHGDKQVAEGELKDLMRLVETFGFYLVKLDIRQESSRHTQAVAELFQTQQLDYLQENEEKRLELLADFILVQQEFPVIRDNLSPNTRETLSVFEMMAQMHKEISPQAFGNYIISMTHQASQILEVLLLAQQADLLGHTESGWFCHIRITPLFETIEDLSKIETVLQQLYKIPIYRELLKVAGGLQEIMLGYSDSCKDGGIVASSWHLYQAQKKVTTLAQQQGIPCRLFHGRGGSIGRGGGPTYEAIVSQPVGTVHDQIKFTEQGEVLAYKYSNLETATYELMLGVAGLMKASYATIMQERDKPFASPESPEHLSIMTELAEFGEAHYRQLTDATSGFMDYFYEATPVPEIALLNIGSRPVYRQSADRSKYSVRAIPWVFGWSQARYTLPAWYGLGTALEKWCKQNANAMEKLGEMYQHWPFFRVLLSNIQMSLYKTDMGVAHEYALLCRNQQQAQQIYAEIHAEHERTVKYVLAVAHIRELVEENPVLALSLSRRRPYIDPLNAIQVHLLKEYRGQAGKQMDEVQKQRWLNPLLRSINAIAAAMRNTG